jgi:hypothetical protein
MGLGGVLRFLPGLLLASDSVNGFLAACRLLLLLLLLDVGSTCY